MDDDDPPTPVSTFKKRNKVRPSGSTSSLRSASTSAASASTLSFAQDDGDDDDQSGNVAVIRQKKKKTPAGVVRSREGAAAGQGQGQGGAKARLSFGGEGDDAEEEATVVKRSTSTTDSPRRLLRAPGAATPTLPTTLDQATISNPTTSSQPSIYSTEYLNQLKQSTLSAPQAAAHRTDYDALTQSKFGAQLDAIPTNIPTERAIAEAKDRRERIRREGGGTGTDGFISLEVGQVLKGGESRLVREDDELGDGDEDVAAFTESRDTLPLGQKANKLAAQKMRSGIIDLIEDAEEDQAEDEEGREWEEAQIRRGEQRRIITTDGAKATYRPTPIPHASTLPSIGSVSSKLEAALAEARANFTMDNAALSHFAKEREELDAQEKELREEVGKAEEKRRWFSDFKIFIDQVADFLDDKYPSLEKVEADNLAIQRERAEIVARRRFADDADDVALFTGSPVPPTFPTPPADASADDASAADAVAPRSAARAARRAARDRRAAADEGAGTDDELEPDDAADLAAAVGGLREGLAAVFADVRADDFRDPNLGIRRKFEEWRSLFPEEYANAFGGLAMVGVWEFWARVEMGMWNPFEIKQLAKTTPGLDGYQWHANLSSFGHSGGNEADGNPEAEDESEAVVNLLVTSTVIPRLEKLATTYDPLSARQTARAVGVVDEVSYCVDKSSHRFEILIQTFMRQIQLAITRSQTLLAPHLAALALPQHQFDPSTFVARDRFARRQLRLLQNALRWRRYARSLRMARSGEEHEVQLAGGGLLFDELVQRELVAKVILPVVEAGWAGGGEEVARQVVKLLPGEVPPALVRRLQGERA